MKLRYFLPIIAAIYSLSTFLFADGTSEGNKLLVLKTGDTVYIRSYFSEENDIVTPVGIGQFNKQVNFYGAFLIKRTAPMDVASFKEGNYIHRFGDDACPWNINGTYIGANHGASVGLELTCPGHGKDEKELGSEWRDDLGRKFYLIRIVNKDKLLFLGENNPEGNMWKFGGSLQGTTLKSVSGDNEIQFESKRGGAQIYPACRIKKQEYLIDGKTPLKEGEIISCEWLDIVEEYDIINIGSVLADVISHPGQERDFAAGHLDAVLANRITYRFMPNCSNVIYYNARALQEFRLGYMGFIQSQQLAQGNYKTHEYYIPKTLPFTQDNINYDFSSIQDYSFRPPSPLAFNAKTANISYPENIPERFIQFLGNKKGDSIVREVGYALGYSLIHGITVPSVRAKNTSNAITLYVTRKSYPNAVNSLMGPIIPAGKDFYCVAYRQYFNPQAAGNATCLYWNKQEKDTVVYIDYHKSVDKDVIKLPAELAGKKLEVVEKTPSLTMHTQGAVPKKGIEVSVADGYGYIILKIF